MTYEYFGFPADYLATYRKNIEKVTKADVARVANQYIHKEKLAVLVVGPAKGQDRPLDSFGKVTKLDIAIPDTRGGGGPPPGGPPPSAKSGS
jgi:zinc protease